MSLERRRDTKDPKKNNSLETSSFRRNDFTPLGNKVLVQEEVPLEEYEDIEIVDELSEIELDILDIAKEVLKLKRYDTDFVIESDRDKIQKYPIIEKLYAQCVGKLSYKKGYSKEDIFLGIRNLDEKNWIVTNERRTKLEILSNERLVKILDFVKKNPGIHARDERIKDDLQITRTPFLKHVMTLERFKLIRSSKIGKTLHYFPVDVPESYDELKAIFSNPLIPQIIEEILKNDSISIAQVGENLDMYSGTIQYHIKKLMALDLIKSTKNKATDSKVFIVNFELLKKYNKIFKEPDFSKLLQGL